MRKKIFIMVLMLMITTGCSSTVNINIDKNKIEEKVTIVTPNDVEYNKVKNWSGFPVTLYYDQELKNPFGNEKESGVPYYNVNMNDSERTVTASGNFTLIDHKKSSLVRNCFKLYNVISQGNKTIFSTSKGLICSFNQFQLVINTPYTVLENNADITNSDTNTYIWNINKSNAQNASVYLEVDFSKRYNEEEVTPDGKSTPQEEKTVTTVINKKIIYIVLAIVTAVIVLASVYLYKKHKDTSSL